MRYYPRPGYKPVPVERLYLSKAERAALIAEFIKGTANDWQERTALTIANTCRKKKYWLMCDCQTGTTEKAPLMTFRKVDKALHMLRINGRGEHHANCLFKGVKWPRGKNTGKVSAFLPGQVLNLNQQGTRTAAVKEKKNKKRPQGSTQRLPKLARVLYSLCQYAHLASIDLNKSNHIDDKPIEAIAAQYAAVKAAAAQFFLVKHIRLSDYFLTFASASKLAMQLKKDQPPWPKNADKYGVIIAVADEVSSHKARFSTQQSQWHETFQGTVTHCSGRLGKESGPFLVIYTVAGSLDNPHYYQSMDAYVVPVYSKKLLVPIDSRYERKVLTTLRQRLRWWSENNLNVTIEKPLADIEGFNPKTNEPFSVKPDFVLRTNYGAVVLEVMGSHEADYISRKARILRDMQCIGPVIAFDALEAEKNGLWDEYLKEALRACSRKLFAQASLSAMK